MNESVLSFWSPVTNRADYYPDWVITWPNGHSPMINDSWPPAEPDFRTVGIDHSEQVVTAVPVLNLGQFNEKHALIGLLKS